MRASVLQTELKTLTLAQRIALEAVGRYGIVKSTGELEPAYDGHRPGKIDARSLLKLVGLGHVKGTGHGGLCLTASGHDLYQASLGR
jgi:hypothetical protein